MIRCKKSAFLAGLLAVLAAGTTAAQVMPGLAHLPLYFAAAGTNGGPASFLARSSANDVLLSDRAVQINLRHGKAIQMEFSGASPQAQIHGQTELAGKINYLTGNDPQKWRTGIATFSQVQVDGLYPGINAIYYGNDQQLEYDFTVAPGTSPAAISMHFNRSADISVNPHGDLAVAGGDVLLRQPVIYQMVAGARREISGSYKIAGDENGHAVGFNIGKYDATLPLIIDPLVTYSSLLGGSTNEQARAVAIYPHPTNASVISIFIAGQTQSKKLATAGAYQTTNYGGGDLGDAFVARFTPQGTNMHLDFLTYLGGSAENEANAMAVDQNGNVYVGGITDAPDFPVVPATGVPGLTNKIAGAIYPYTGNYFPDGFVSEISADGSHLIFSTYLGGNGSDAVEGLALDSAANVYVTGYTYSTNFPTRHAVNFFLEGNPDDPELDYLACTNTFFNCNAFVAKIAAGGTSLDYSSYFGGQNYDVGTGIAVDAAANVYVTGFTCSTNFPNKNAFQPYINSGLNRSNQVNRVADAFVAKFGPTTTSPPLLYSTFLGNTNQDQATAIAVDAQGAAYVTGFTASTNFPNTTTVTVTNVVSHVTNISYLYPVILNHLTNNIDGINSTTNVFLTKIQTNTNGYAEIVYSVVFGGLLNDSSYGVAVDPAGDAFVTGSANSAIFPTNNTFGLLSPKKAGDNDVFVTAFNPDCTQVLYSGYLGGGLNDEAYGIAVDSQSTVYIAGKTASGAFPFTTNVDNFPIVDGRTDTLQGSYGAFLAKIQMFNLSLVLSNVEPHQISLTWLYNTNVGPEMADYVLQFSTNLTTTYFTVTNISGGKTNKIEVPSTNWFAVTNMVTYTNNFRSLTFTTTNESEFFRLYSGITNNTN